MGQAIACLAYTIILHCAHPHIILLSLFMNANHYLKIIHYVCDYLKDFQDVYGIFK